MTDENLKEVLINKLIEDGDINEESLRDYKIRKLYNVYRKTMSCKKARLKVAEKYPMSDDNIQRILYRKKSSNNI